MATYLGRLGHMSRVHAEFGNVNKTLEFAVGVLATNVSQLIIWNSLLSNVIA